MSMLSCMNICSHTVGSTTPKDYTQPFMEVCFVLAQTTRHVHYVWELEVIEKTRGSLGF